MRNVVLASIAGFAALAAASTALAQGASDPGSPVPIAGTVPGQCGIVPSTTGTFWWNPSSAGVFSGKYNQTSRVINLTPTNDSTLVHSSGRPISLTSAGDGIRLRTRIFCNTTGTATFTTTNAGLVRTLPSSPPSGFLNRFPLRYDFYLTRYGAAGSGSPCVGECPNAGSTQFDTAALDGGTTTTGGSRTLNITSSTYQDAVAVDVRIGMRTDTIGATATSGPVMVSGAYSDTVTVTFTPGP